ncbi:hypothetical protein ES288_A11G178300v1 [Gossypium darwinii]|uniref:Uncharacterized protein n=1 Tax=Gossypium darwinii TaxID=34276 RepID=A0A5D2EMH6_GOSDA|nr:hypothetical protein ES288_A11G178300v1 [Gossypium darwinii]
MMYNCIGIGLLKEEVLLAVYPRIYCSLSADLLMIYPHELMLLLLWCVRLDDRWMSRKILLLNLHIHTDIIVKLII